jgi:transposase
VQTQTKNRISAVLHRHGIIHEHSDLFGAGGRKFLGRLCGSGQAGEVTLPPGALSALRGLMELLHHVRGQLAGIAVDLRGRLERDEVSQRLDGIPGIGLILAHTLLAEVGVIERFTNQRALANYSLLAPISNDTGQDDGPPAHRPPPRPPRQPDAQVGIHGGRAWCCQDGRAMAEAV